MSSDYSLIYKQLKELSTNLEQDLHSKFIVAEKEAFYRYYDQYYYFLPKGCLLKFQAKKNFVGYVIKPNSKFYIKNENFDDPLIYSTRTPLTILPENNISLQIADNIVSLNIEFHSGYKHDEIILWFNPSISKEYYYEFLDLKNLITSKYTKGIVYINGQTYLKDIKSSVVTYDLGLLEQLAINLNFKEMSFGIRLKILNYIATSDILNINIQIKLHKIPILGEQKYEDILNKVFISNIIPVFNIFDDYSDSINILPTQAEYQIRNTNISDAKPVEIIAIYENSKQIEYQISSFQGEKEYFFQKNIGKIIVKPFDLSEQSSVRIKSLLYWTNKQELKKIDQITTNEIIAANMNISAIFSSYEINNYYLDFLNLKKVIDGFGSYFFDKESLGYILRYFNVSSEKTRFFLEHIYDLSFDNINYKFSFQISDFLSKKEKLEISFFIENIFLFLNNCINQKQQLNYFLEDI